MEWVSGLGVLVAIHLSVFLVLIPIKYRIHYKKNKKKKEHQCIAFFFFFLINYNIYIYINQIEAGALQSTSQIVLKTSGRLSLSKQKDLEDERESLAVA